MDILKVRNLVEVSKVTLYNIAAYHASTQPHVSPAERCTCDLGRLYQRLQASIEDTEEELKKSK